MSKNYKVICQKCKGYSELNIDDYSRVTYKNIGQVISARFRLDNNWGFECLCGQDSRMTDQEKRMISDWTNPRPLELDEIKNNLVIQNDNKFIMKGI